MFPNAGKNSYTLSFSISDTFLSRAIDMKIIRTSLVTKISIPLSNDFIARRIYIGSRLVVPILPRGIGRNV